MAKSKDVIGLLFGVEGGSKVNGATGKEIISTLKELVSEINTKNKLPKLSLEIAFSEKSVNDAVKDLVAKVNDKLKDSAEKIIDKVNTKLKKNSDDLVKKAKDKIKKSTSTTKSKASVKKTAGGTKQSKKNDEGAEALKKEKKEISKLINLTKKYYSLQTQVNKINMKTGGHGYEEKSKELKHYIKGLKALGATVDEKKQEVSIKNKTFSKDAQEMVDSWKAINDSLILKRKSSDESNDKSVLRTWTKNAEKALTYIRNIESMGPKHPDTIKGIKEIEAIIKSGDPKRLEELTTKLGKFQHLVKINEDDIESWGNKFKKTFGSRVRSVLAGIITLKISQGLTQIYNNVKQLDSALVNLQIASGKTREETRELIKDYADLGKQLGATTAEVAASADTWLRQGYEVSEATELIKNSMILSKLGQIDSETAAKNLTSAMKGYKVSVEDSIGIIDKFTAVDMQAAASAGDLATAMSETATSAGIAGVPMDKLIGQIAVVKEVTQDGAESVGTFYKTMYARMNNVKAGKFVDDESGESLNDTEKVLGKLGIALRDTNGLFRNSGDVLDEVAQGWKSYNNVQQHAIATAFAGTRQQEKFIVLMENYGDALKYAETAANSSGTALEKYKNYTDGIEASFNALTASFEEFSISLLNSDMIVGVVKLLSNVLTLITKITNGIGGLNSVLTITATTFLVLKSKDIIVYFKDLSEKIRDAKESFEKWKKTISDDGVGKTIKKMSAETKTQIAFSSIAIAIGVAVTALNAYIAAQDRNIKRASEEARKTLDKAKSHEEEQKTLQELIDAYKKLEEEEDKYSDKEHMQKAESIQKEIVDLVGDQVEGIDLVNGALETQLDLLNKISDKNKANSKEEAERALKQAEIAIRKEMDRTVINPFDREFLLPPSYSGENIVVKEGYANPGYTVRAIEYAFDNVADLIAQYEAVLKYYNEEFLPSMDINDKGDIDSDQEIRDFLERFKSVYTGYTEAKKFLDGLNSPDSKTENESTKSPRGIIVTLETELEMLEKVQGGYDGLSEAMKALTKEGYLNASSLSSVLKLIKENKLAGLELSDVLVKEADGYKLVDGALDKYIAALIKSYTIVGTFRSYADKMNAIKNLKTLQAILLTLAQTQEDIINADETRRKQLEGQKDTLNDRLDAYRKLIDLRLKLIKSYKDEIDYKKELDKKQNTVSKLQARLAVAERDTSAAGLSNARKLREELNTAQSELSDFTLEHAIDVLSDKLENQYSEYEAFIKDKLDGIDETLNKINNNKNDKPKQNSPIANIEKLLEEVDKSIDEISKAPVLTNVVPPSPKPNSIIKKEDYWRKYWEWVASGGNQYHSGGFVGGLNKNEEFAKLLKGEFVSTPSQIKKFMTTTLPTIASYGGGGNSFNAPLIEITCGSITQDALPEFKSVVNQAVNEIKRQINDGISRTGYKKKI